jgi:hypothetical protein
MAACSAQSGGGRRTLAGPGGPKGRMGRLAAGSIGQNWKENSFQSKNWFFNIPWLWKFVQEDIGGILMWGFFLNSSWLFKDFRKIKYAMPCNASYARLFLAGFSYARQIDMQPICTSILAKFYSCKMWLL